MIIKINIKNYSCGYYTTHEHLREFGLINMNGRLYDPQIARMLSPDNFVQDATSTQGYNRYSYVLNNPMKYKDPSGEFIFTVATLIAAPFTGGASLGFLPAAIGADMGMWQGGSLANGTMNPLKWDYSSGKTWGYMGAGAVVGGLSGYIVGAVTTSGMPFANTAGLVAGSFINSVGTHIYTGGQTDVSVNFGIGSFNISKGEVRGLWNWNDLSKGVNVKTIYAYKQFLDKGGKYNLLLNNCVSQTSRALNLSGVFNIGIHPYLLHLEMYLRSIGIRPLLYSHFFTN